MKEILVIAGPTASGKSSLALEIAKEVNGYIINADSRQVYREIPICTAQPVPDNITPDGSWIINGIEHFLYGFRSIQDGYNVYRYRNDVNEILNRKSNRERIPIITGGTGLYIDSVVFNYQLQSGNNQPDFSRNYLQTLSVDELQQIVGDSLFTLNDSDKRNPVRLIRIIEKSGETTTKGSPIPHKYFLIDPTNEELESNILKRIEEMFNNGVVEQNRQVWEKYKEDLPKSLNTIGFTEFIPYFKEEITIEQVKENLFIHTRQYAKKQRTWFKRNTDTQKVKSVEEILAIAA